MEKERVLRLRYSSALSKRQKNNLTVLPTTVENLWPNTTNKSISRFNNFRRAICRQFGTGPSEMRSRFF